MEKVLIQPLRRMGPPIRVDARVARVLVDRQTYAYAEDDRSTYVLATDRQEAKAAQTADVEVEFTPSEKLDVKPTKKAGKRKRTYKRRDMKAEGE